MEFSHRIFLKLICYMNKIIKLYVCVRLQSWQIKWIDELFLLCLWLPLTISILLFFIFNGLYPIGNIFKSILSFSFKALYPTSSEMKPIVFKAQPKNFQSLLFFFHSANIYRMSTIHQDYSYMLMIKLAI